MRKFLAGGVGRTPPPPPPPLRIPPVGKTLLIVIKHTVYEFLIFIYFVQASSDIAQASQYKKKQAFGASHA